MKYLIDHLTKTIHHRGYAGDRCDFLDTPIDKREFSGDEAYIERLKTDRGYINCLFCKTFQSLSSKHEFT
ncbi:hypothetical protein [Planococcus sp. YIM B11945]|uniref:hypothetical protein n=1 Tax=Planococcus sp. YIM B11945 TaxID=3435410 RepID=UPI003D7D98ED